MKQNLVVKHVKNKDYTGIVFSENMVTRTNEKGLIETLVMIGVCWKNKRVPAISYHTPEELEWLELQPIVIEEMYTEEEEEDEEDETEYEAETDTTQEATI